MNENKESIVGIIISTVVILMLLGLGYINGYYSGLYDSMRDCQVSYANNVVTISFDKWSFPHYVGQ